MSDEKYNGYANRETWCIGLWLGKDESTYSWVCELASEAESVEDLANRLKSEVEEHNPLREQANIYSDLLSGALRRVNWYKLAEHYWEDREAIS